MDRESTLNIYHGIFHALFANRQVSVYTLDRAYRDVFKDSPKISISETLENSDIALITDERTLNDVLYTMNGNTDYSKKPMLMVTNYKFVKVSDKIVAAFYWRKGRSQLLFIKKRLEQYDTILPEEYQKFMIDEL